MKKIICMILFGVLMVSLLSACGYREPPKMGFLAPEQFTDYKLGTITELVSEDVINEKIDSPKIVKFTSVEKGLNALRNKKLHGFVLPAVYKTNEMEKTDDFLTTTFPFIDKKLCALSLNSSQFVMPVDAALTSIENNGIMQKIANAHSPYADESDPYVRPTEYDKLAGRTITIGICSDDAFPFNYRDADGNLIGINVDVAYEIAKGAYAELVIKEYPEDKLMGALDSGEVDIILSQYFEDPKNPSDAKYIYSHSYCDASIYVLIRSALADYPDNPVESAE